MSTMMVEQAYSRKAITSALRKSGDRRYRAVASDDSIDRDHEVLPASGWRLEEFRRNPVLLWSHDATKVVGRVPEIRVEGGSRLVCELEFPPNGVSPLADEIGGMVEAGMIRSLSVGYSASEPPTPRSDGAMVYRGKQTLYEVSLVSVPANAAALMLSGKAHDPGRVAAWAAARDRDGVLFMLVDDEPTGRKQAAAFAELARVVGMSPQELERLFRSILQREAARTTRPQDEPTVTIDGDPATLPVAPQDRPRQPAPARGDVQPTPEPTIYVVDEPARPRGGVYDLSLADANTKPEKGRSAGTGPTSFDLGMSVPEFKAALRRSVQEALIPVTGKLPD